MGNCINVESQSPESEVYDPERWILIENKTKYETDLKVEEFLCDEVKIVIKRSLMRSGIFLNEINRRKISSSDIDKIVNCFKLEFFNDEEMLFRQNEQPCDNMFIVKRGLFRGKDRFNNCKAIMTENDMMGEMEFFDEIPRMLSIVANGNNPAAYCLNKRDFKAIVEKGRDLSVIKLFESLSDDQRYLLKKRITIVNFVKGDIILALGSAIPATYVILSGLVHVLKGSSSSSSKKVKLSSGINSPNDTIMAPGEYFGEEKFLIGENTSSKTFIAINETSLCVIKRELFDNVEIFGPARAQMIINIALRKKECDKKKRRHLNRMIDESKSELLPKTESKSELLPKTECDSDDPLKPHEYSPLFCDEMFLNRSIPCN